MVKIITDGSVSSAIAEAKKRTAEFESMQQKYEELVAGIGAEEITGVLGELDIKLTEIDEDIAMFASHKIAALDEMGDCIKVLAEMGERHEASSLIKRPIPSRRPRSEDVVTGKIYPNPAVACSVEGIKFDFVNITPARAWVVSKGYPLRDIK
jgi:hypothetical protein